MLSITISHQHQSSLYTELVSTCVFNFTTLLSSSLGRVARAGRSGTAYSLVAADEVPYMIDLHLFLGKPISTSGVDGVNVFFP